MYKEIKIEGINWEQISKNLRDFLWEITTELKENSKTYNLDSNELVEVVDGILEAVSFFEDIDQCDFTKLEKLFYTLSLIHSFMKKNSVDGLKDTADLIKYVIDYHVGEM